MGMHKKLKRSASLTCYTTEITCILEVFTKYTFNCPNTTTNTPPSAVGWQSALVTTCAV